MLIWSISAVFSLGNCDNSSLLKKNFFFPASERCCVVPGKSHFPLSPFYSCLFGERFTVKILLSWNISSKTKTKPLTFRIVRTLSELEPCQMLACSPHLPAALACWRLLEKLICVFQSISVLLTDSWSHSSKLSIFK